MRTSEFAVSLPREITVENLEGRGECSKVLNSFLALSNVDNRNTVHTSGNALLNLGVWQDTFRRVLHGDER